MAQQLVIVGIGGFGREVADLVEDINAVAPAYELIGFLDDSPSEEALEVLSRSGLSYLGTVESFLNAPVTNFVIGIASPTARQTVHARLAAAGHLPATLIHPSATVGRLVEIGPGSIVCAGARLTTNIRLGRHVHVNLNATIGHDSVVGDFVTIYPAAAVSGNVRLEEEVSLGVGSAVLQGLTVGQATFVGAAALVTKDIAPRLVVKGIPAR